MWTWSPRAAQLQHPARAGIEARACRNPWGRVADQACAEAGPHLLGHLPTTPRSAPSIPPTSSHAMEPPFAQIPSCLSWSPSESTWMGRATGSAISRSTSLFPLRTGPCLLTKPNTHIRNEGMDDCIGWRVTAVFPDGATGEGLCLLLHGPIPGSAISGWVP